MFRPARERERRAKTSRAFWLLRVLSPHSLAKIARERERERPPSTVLVIFIIPLCLAAVHCNLAFVVPVYRIDLHSVAERETQPVSPRLGCRPLFCSTSFDVSLRPPLITHLSHHFHLHLHRSHSVTTQLIQQAVIWCEKSASSNTNRKQANRRQRHTSRPRKDIAVYNCRWRNGNVDDEVDKLQLLRTLSASVKSILSCHWIFDTGRSHLATVTKGTFRTRPPTSYWVSSVKPSGDDSGEKKKEEETSFEKNRRE